MVDTPIIVCSSVAQTTDDALDCNDDDDDDDERVILESFNSKGFGSTASDDCAGGTEFDGSGWMNGLGILIVDKTGELESVCMLKTEEPCNWLLWFDKRLIMLWRKEPNRLRSQLKKAGGGSPCGFGNGSIHETVDEFTNWSESSCEDCRGCCVHGLTGVKFLNEVWYLLNLGYLSKSS